MKPKRKVLLVEDQANFRNLVKMLLSKNYYVETAENGIQALQLLKNGYMPDIIVSDLVMPTIDGKNLLEYIRSDIKYSHLPVIILSNVDLSSHKVEMLKLGAKDYITKPYYPEELDIYISLRLKALLN
jgi:two-component system chemotaxis response regulator CheY